MIKFLVLIFLSSCSMLPYIDADVEIDFKHPAKKSFQSNITAENLESLADRIIHEYKNAGILRAVCNRLYRHSDFSPSIYCCGNFFEMPEDGG